MTDIQRAMLGDHDAAARLPEDADSVKAKYRELAKSAHPDAGGDEETFLLLRANLNKCLTWFVENGRAG